MARPFAFAVKAAVDDLGQRGYRFLAWKTMYGGKFIARDDTVFLFASGAAGGKGLFAKGVATWAAPVAKPAGARQTPRVDLTVEVSAQARRRLGRRAPGVRRLE